MDSVSQAALGAAVGVAVLGRHRPYWQAALSGAALGTLPDLDVVIDHGDPISNMVWHRAESHAFFWQIIAAFPVAALLAWLTRKRELWWRWLGMVLAVFITHAVLDALTVYGTRLALPFSEHPFGSASLFIIDPLYTLPLLFGLLISAFRRGERRRRAAHIGLALSTLYIGWALSAQAWVTLQVMQQPLASELKSEQLLVTPAPFNTLLWRIVLIEDSVYHEGFYSLLDKPGPIRFKTFARGDALDQRTAHFTVANQLRDFTKGFYRVSDDGEGIYLTDLRMGQEPFYVFHFKIADSLNPSEPIFPQRYSQRMPLEGGLEWLWQRLQGQDIDSPGWR